MLQRIARPWIMSSASVFNRMLSGGTRRRREDKKDEDPIAEEQILKNKVKELNKVQREHFTLSAKLRQKETITSVLGVLAQKQLESESDSLKVEIQEREGKKKGRKLHWYEYKRRRMGNSKYSRYMFRYPRKTCYRNGRWSASCCPVCRDEHWYPKYTDVTRLVDYVDPRTDTLISNHITQVCQYKQSVLKEAVNIAQRRGLLKPRIVGKQFTWTSEEVYGRNTTEIYTPYKRYNKRYRHLPGNVHYEPDNETWGHVPLTTARRHTAFDYE